MRLIFTKLRRLLLRGGLLLAALLLGALGLRAFDTWRDPPLRPWHLFVPPELSAKALDATDWRGMLVAEDAAFAAVRRNVTDVLEPEDRIPANRHFAGSPMHTPNFAVDWNRSFILAPEGAPLGAVVLLHGLTDAPYSMRHLALLYRARGFLAVVPRMPGHGTVPGGLSAAAFEEWLATVRLAMREARARAGAGMPLHIVGYSNGGALALKYTLDSLEDQALPRPERVVLVAPMVGVTAFARFAGLAGLPALLPAFAGAAWLDILPEFNPFKYNSFPVNGARQSYRLTTALQSQLQRLQGNRALGPMPPVLTFQSVTDATVSARAVVTELYGRLPSNGSELVLFDLNRNAKLGPLISPAALAAADQLLPPAPQPWRMTLVTNADSGQAEVVERSTPAGEAEAALRPLGLAWPRNIHSLSHIALQFPVQDGLFGLEPDPAEDFGVQLGAFAARGERGVLTTSLDGLLRLSSNPFYPYLRQRIEAMIGAGR